MAPQTTLADVERAKARAEQLIAKIYGTRTTQELREIWRGEVQPFLVSPLMFEQGLDSLLQYLTEARDKRQAELSKMYLEESTARWHADSENRKRRELEESKRLSRRRGSNLGTTADVIGSPGWFGESQRHSEAARRGKGGVVSPVERPNIALSLSPEMATAYNKGMADGEAGHPSHAMKYRFRAAYRNGYMRGREKLKYRVATALDATHAIGERGPKTYQARQRLATALDMDNPDQYPISTIDLRWLEKVAREG